MFRKITNLKINKMKHFFISTVFAVLICNAIHAQNGVYQSTKFEFISQNEPSRNRIDYTKNTLTFQINEIQGEFIGGKILWEMKSEGQSEFLEMSLKSIKNSHFDDANNAFIKVYNADLKILGQVISQAEIFVWRFVNDNTYRVDMYDPIKKTINRFDKIIKL
jgi:uncharacterized protein YqfB (UPF0267 family)